VNEVTGVLAPGRKAWAVAVMTTTCAVRSAWLTV
jgi:hypothetical protein